MSACVPALAPAARCANVFPKGKRAMPDGATTSPAELAAPASDHASPTRGELARRILALAAPTTLGAAVQSACMLAETWLAARQGTAALAGWAVVLPFSLLLGMMSAGA